MISFTSKALLRPAQLAHFRTRSSAVLNKRGISSGSSTAFTLFLQPEQDKVSAAQQLPASLPSPSDAAVILTTPAFSRWLEDEAFMAHLLGPSSSETVDVVSGVVDGLAPTSQFCSPADGFSVFRGASELLLPRLWDHDLPLAQKPGKSHGYLDFCAETASGALTTTVPLANTVFSNSREATLFASSWTCQNGALKHQKVLDKAFQKIVLPGVFSPRFSAPLVPILPARRITGCLGNILSGIEVAGQEVPASTELETIVPKIYSQRMESTPEAQGVEVWALLVPGSVGTGVRVHKDLVSVFSNRDHEAAVASEACSVLSTLFESGAELYRIESGGGGWGKKKGRLALDTKWEPASPPVSDAISTDEFLDFPSFMRQGIAPRGLIAPGSWLQFFISPMRSRALATAASMPAPAMSSITFGSARDPLDGYARDSTCTSTSTIDSAQKQPLVQPGYFTGIAAEGIHVTHHHHEQQKSQQQQQQQQLESPFARLSLCNATL